MFGKIRKRVSAAHILAAMALFIALGGSAYALKKNTVGTKQLKNGAVTEQKLAGNSVSTAKIAADAVTGDKVNESSLGKVPSAATADTATTATDATNAANAANSAELEGRTLGQVRSLATFDTRSADLNLPSAGYAEVLNEPIAIPSGGASMVVNASVEIANNGAGGRNATCVLRSDGIDISQEITVQAVNPGISVNVAMTGFASFANATAIGDPENVQMLCEGSVANGDMEFQDGDLTIQRIPIGT